MCKLYQVLVQDLDENMDENLKDMDENLAWLTQKTEDLKGTKGTLLFLVHRCKIMISQGVFLYSFLKKTIL